MKNDILKMQGVTKVFYTKTAQTVAVENLSLAVKEGEFVAIIGPSGCGKTTLLSLIAKLIEPTTGSILLSSNKKHAVGYMLQQDHLFPWRTVEKNVLLGLEVTKNLNYETKKYASDLLEKYGLGDFKKHLPSQISGGMRQRVALIRTLATNPDLLLLDEPFSALDFQTRLEVCDDVYSIIRRENKTTVLVTHDISEAISVADKIYVLSKRPAKVKKVFQCNLQEYTTPLKRRESEEFGKYFEEIYKCLNGADDEL